jgi:hypothetical protein
MRITWTRKPVTRVKTSKKIYNRKSKKGVDRLARV